MPPPHTLQGDVSILKRVRSGEPKSVRRNVVPNCSRLLVLRSFDPPGMFSCSWALLECPGQNRPQLSIISDSQ
ncbi:hypothetical protein AOLI_G00291680 [Acnodon oligacanthus]